MKEPLVLTFDIGTQSLRAMLVNQKGEFRELSQIKYDEPYFSPHDRWAEQKPDFYFDTMCKASKILYEKDKHVFDDVIAVTLTVIRDTVMCLDKDRKPLRNIILWLDKREAEKYNFPAVTSAAFRLVGMEDTAKMQYRATVANWIMENEPEIWEKTDKYVMLPTYLNYRLTGRLLDSTANMIGHVPFDNKKKQWMGKALTRCVYDIPIEKLCDLTEPGKVIGTITAEASSLTGIPEGLPLIATGSDKGCETLGLSVMHPGQASLSFGTTATIQVATKDYFEPQKFMPAYPAIIGDMYNPEIQIYSGFWLLSWFIKEFAHEERYMAQTLGCSAEKLLDDKLKDIPAGCDGLVLQPYWSPGITIPNSRGTVTGFTDRHTKYHLYRAIIEGVGFALYEAKNTLEKRSKVPITEIFVGGGGSKSDPICQITADIFGLPVKRIQTHEACGLGSSMVAFVSKGIFSDYDEAARSMIRIGDTFTPDAENHEIYSRIFNDVYVNIYPRLSPVFSGIKNIYTKRSKS